MALNKRKNFRDGAGVSFGSMWPGHPDYDRRPYCEPKVKECLLADECISPVRCAHDDICLIASDARFDVRPTGNFREAYAKEMANQDRALGEGMKSWGCFRPER